MAKQSVPECLSAQQNKGARHNTSVSGRRVAHELIAMIERRRKPGINHGTELTPQ